MSVEKASCAVVQLFVSPLRYALYQLHPFLRTQSILLPSNICYYYFHALFPCAFVVSLRAHVKRRSILPRRLLGEISPILKPNYKQTFESLSYLFMIVFCIVSS